MQPAVSQTVSAPPGARPGTRLKGRYLTLAHAAWWFVLVSSVSMTVLAMPLYYQFLTAICPANCTDQQLTPVLYASLQSVGWSIEDYALYTLALNLLVPAAYVTVAAFIYWRKRNDALALFVSFTLILFGTAGFAGFYPRLVASNPAWAVPVYLYRYLGSFCLILFFLVFPSGQVIPRWMRWLIPVVAVEAVFDAFLSTSTDTLIQLTYAFLFVSVLVLALYSQVYRYRHVSTAQERQQTKWVVFGVVTALAGFLLGVAVLIFFGDYTDSNIVPFVLVFTLLALFISLIPASIGIAILRSHLWDIDLIINRALVYGAITAIEAGIFAATITITQKFFVSLTGETSDAAAVLTTLVVVAAFDPVKKRVEKFVEGRFKYPTRSLGAFGEQLKTYVQFNDSQELLKKLLSESLKTFNAESGAVYLGAGAQLRLVSTEGKWQDHAELAVPLEHNGARLGMIALGARHNGEPYTEQDRAHLKSAGDLAAHVLELQSGASQHAATVTH